MMPMEGLEARFGGRFKEAVTITESELKATGDALSVAQQLKDAREEIIVRTENLKRIFAASVAMAQQVNKTQEQGGIKEFENIPIPTKEVASSDAKKAIYSSTCVQFYAYTTSVLYERLLTTRAELASANKQLSAIAAYEGEVERSAKMTSVEYDPFGAT